MAVLGDVGYNPNTTKVNLTGDAGTFHMGADASSRIPINSATTATSARQDLWRQFKENTVPTLKEIQEQIASRTNKYVAEATDSTNKAIQMAERQSELSREALGISLTDEQVEGQSRLNRLGGTSARVSAQNEAVDIADTVNKNQANALLNIQTGLTQESLADLQGADSLKDARLGGDSARRVQAKNSNLQTVGTVATIAAMFM